MHVPLADKSANEFFAAITTGDVARVRALLDAEPDLAETTAPDGASAALTALCLGWPALADELAARAGSLSVFEAAAFDDTDRLAELIQRDPALVRAWSADGWQPLHLAARFGRVEAARMLLDADAPAAEASRNDLLVQPLHAAVAGRHHELVWVLIASDVPVDARRHNGSTPLQVAVGNGDVACVQALLAASADPSLADDDGLSAIDLAPDDAIRRLLDEARRD